MSRRPNAIPSVMLNVALPLDVHTQMNLHLYSDLEGRVPQGAYQRFLVELIRERLTGKVLDLTPYIPEAMPGVFQVSGNVESILALKYRLGGPL